MIVAVLIVRGVGESWLAVGIGVAAVDGPAVVKAALSTLHREGHDIHFVALGAQTLLHFGDVLIVEKAEVFHVLVLPAMAAGHHYERAAVLGQVVEGHPGGDELIRTARPPIGVIGVPAGADARGVARAGGLVEKLIVQQADDFAVHEPGGDGADEWIEGELDHFLLLQGEEFIDPLPVAVAFLPIHEAGVKRQDVINFSVPKALNAIVSRVQQGLGNEAFPGDVVAIRFVEGDVGVAGQEGALFGCEREGLHRWHLRSCQVSSCNARETPRGQTAGRKAILRTGGAAPAACRCRARGSPRHRAPPAGAGCTRGSSIFLTHNMPRSDELLRWPVRRLTHKFALKYWIVSMRDTLPLEHFPWRHQNDFTIQPQ